MDIDRYGVEFNQCGSGFNQVFDLVDNGDVIPTPPVVDPPTVTPPSVSPGKPIKWDLNGQQKCLTVANGNLANGVPLSMSVQVCLLHLAS